MNPRSSDRSGPERSRSLQSNLSPCRLTLRSTRGADTRLLVVHIDAARRLV
jgi:hypothetical protein